MQTPEVSYADFSAYVEQSEIIDTFIQYKKV